MSEAYNSEVSMHYASYRPPVHALILAEIFEPDSQFKLGLDIGCGTGASSEALCLYCVEVMGLEPSQAMLSHAIQKAGVTYAQGSGDHIPLKSGSVDIVTFAGSLCYAKTAKLVEELIRVCRPMASIVVYDFDVDLTEPLALLEASLAPRTSNYNHCENFSGEPKLKEQRVVESKLILTVTSQQLAHILFSSQRRLVALKERFGHSETFDTVITLLNRHSKHHKIPVNIYYSTYTVRAVS